MFRLRTLAPSFLGLLLVFTQAAASAPSKRYPDFAARKDSLGSITLLVESAVLVDVNGDVKRVELADSRRFADCAAEGFRDALAAKGYAVDRAIVASMGSLLEPAARFAAGERGEGSAPDADGRALNPPFYLDSTLAGHPALHAAWGSLCKRLLGYVRGKNRTPDYVPEPILLGDSLGARVLGVVVVNGWNVPTGKQVKQALFSTLLTAGLVTAHKVSVSRLEFALLDARSGEIVWSEFGGWESGVNEPMIRKFVASTAKALP